MDAERILRELNRRFAEPLPEFYKRRIIVWRDDEGEFKDRIREIEPTNAKVAALTGTNFFAVKKLLAVDDPTSDYLVYCPFAHDSLEDDWLLDIELYSEEFRADLVSMWMEEMGIPQKPALRDCVKACRAFFNAGERRGLIGKLAARHLPATPAQLQLAIMAALAGLNEAKLDAIVKAVLQGGLSDGENPVYLNFEKYGIAEAFWNMAAQGTGCREECRSLAGLAKHLLLTAATCAMRPECLAGLENFISAPHQGFCYDLVSDWMRGEDAPALREIAEAVERESRLPQRFMKLTVDDLAGTEIFPSVDEVILVKLMGAIEDNIIDIDAIRRVVDKRRTCAWYEATRNFYEGISHLADMQAFYKEHAGGFHTVEPKKVWEEYTRTYYRMDAAYRRFHRSYAASLKSYHAELADRFTSVREKAEGLYTNWFLEQLGDNWSNASAAHLRDYGRILDVPKQADFYRKWVASSHSRVYVLVSDALRYEVAVSLAEQLRLETRSKVNIGAMQAIFPTTTKFGMAALLPHDNLSVELKSGKTERLTVLADGQSTEANNRDKVLKTKNGKSVALKYKEIIGMKRAERQALVKGMEVVYIYHDTIDEAGHLEKSIFEACDEAIDELKNIVRIITNEFGGTNILITADHGFLYTHSPLREDGKVDMTGASERDVEIGRRHAVMRAGARPEYLLPVKFLDGDTGFEAFAPRENIRIKMKGGGLNFVHGGISLQEMVVPVIEYHYLRNDAKDSPKYETRPVTIRLLSASRKISNMIFSLDFYQEEPVGGAREAATYQLYFADSADNAVSDTARIIADKTGDNAQERIIRCRFNLKSLKYSRTESYWLVIRDEDGLPIAREEFQIDIAMAIDDFGFFS